VKAFKADDGQWLVSYKPPRLYAGDVSAFDGRNVLEVETDDVLATNGKAPWE
jgi:hypothetical protein